MIRATAICIGIATAGVAAGCGGGGGDTTTGASQPATTPVATAPTSPTTTLPHTEPTSTGTTSTSGGGSGDPKVEISKITDCLNSQGAKRVEPKPDDQPPFVSAQLPSGTGVGFETFGSAGGAKARGAIFSKKYPQDDVYESPNDHVLIIFAHKASKQDFDIGNTCQKAAYQG